MVSFKCFSGAKTKQLHYYVVPTLVDETPQTVIHICSSDIMERKIKQINLDDLAQKVIDIGLKCRSCRVCNIAISSILVRSSIRVNQIISKVSNILKVLCATNGFNFIRNDEIGRKMIWKDVGFKLQSKQNNRNGWRTSSEILGAQALEYLVHKLRNTCRLFF